MPEIGELVFLKNERCFGIIRGISLKGFLIDIGQKALIKTSVEMMLIFLVPANDRGQSLEEIIDKYQPAIFEMLFLKMIFLLAANNPVAAALVIN